MNYSFFKKIYILILFLAFAQITGCEEREIQRQAETLNSSASTEIMYSNKRVDSKTNPIQRIVRFSDFVDSNGIMPSFAFVENQEEVWFLSVNDSQRKSYRYNIDSNSIVSEIAFNAGTQASNDPRTSIKPTINDSGDLSLPSGEILHLPGFSNIVPADFSASLNKVAYTNEEKSLLMIYDLISKKMSRNFVLDELNISSNSLPIFCTQIKLLNEQYVCLSLLDVEQASSIAIVDITTGGIVFTLEGSYTAFPINEDQSLIRPSLGGNLNDVPYILSLNNGNPLIRRIENIENGTEKITIKLSDNGRFAVTNKMQDENIVFTLYETEKFSVVNIFTLDNTKGEFDCILNGDYQLVSNDGKNLLILDNQWQAILIHV